ncbi:MULTISPECIES: ABC transporter permease [unclassified Streptomyces]|uniref:ABC transporter permease n=1 Tax=unclassified Streptomyces TaxID=2593676 RepID=UPI0006FA738D|nr:MULTISPECIES: ABC transporter permease [unclassified Streptomyces]KQX46183.1 ABC transporter permease [Streptomyces sp. Root1304]KRA80968.1 ABC transporter permease [Streptomyces sp. Root66D1]
MTEIAVATAEPRTVGSRVEEPAARFRDLLASEWLKLWSLRSTGCSLLLSALAVIAFNVGTAWDHYRYWWQYGPQGRADFVANEMALGDAFTGNASTVLILCAAAMGAVAVVGEYGSGLIRTSFAAVPARSALMSAKVLVVAVVQTGFGAVVAGVSFWLSQAVLSVRDAGLPITHPGALRLVVASALLAPVCAVTGMALGALLRRSAVSVVGSVLLLLFVPMVLSERRHATAVLAHTTPLKAWQRLAAPGAFEQPYPWTAGGAWLVFALWAVGAAVVTVLAVRRRDQ